MLSVVRILMMALATIIFWERDILVIDEDWSVVEIESDVTLRQ